MKSKNGDSAVAKKNMNWLRSFGVYDLVLLAMLTGLSIAFKTIVGTLIRLVTGPFGIPSGAIAGGLYMLWIPLAIVVTNRRGAGFLLALVQTVIMIATGAPGSHGVWTVFSYLTPALAVEIVYFVAVKRGHNILHFMIACLLANVVGTLASNFLFFRLAIEPLVFVLIAGALSGAIGGVIGYMVYLTLEKTGLLQIANARPSAKRMHKYLGQAYTRQEFVQNTDESTIENKAQDKKYQIEDIDCNEVDALQSEH